MLIELLFVFVAIPTTQVEVSCGAILVGPLPRGAAAYVPLSTEQLDKKGMQNVYHGNDPRNTPF